MSVGAARSIYVVAPEGGTGKSIVALGLVHLLTRRVRHLGVFRPVVRTGRGDDALLGLLLDHAESDAPPAACVGVTYDAVHADPDAALATIVERHRELARTCDAIVVVGSDYTDVASPTELAFNARVAANIGAPVVLVVNAWERTPGDVEHLLHIATAELAGAHATTVAAVANRCDPDPAAMAAMAAAVASIDLPAWVLPEVPLLSAPLLSDLRTALDGTLLLGDDALLEREAEEMLVCAMDAEHVLERLADGQVCIAAGDRPDLLVALAAAHAAQGFPTLAGIVLNGGYRPGERVLDLVEGLDVHLPVLLTDRDSYEVARTVASTRGFLATGTPRKVDTALGVFESGIDGEELLRVVDVPPSPVVTPLMFESTLLERARADRRHIVLPEGDDDRVLRAAATLLSRQIVDVTLLGNEAQIRARAAALGADLDGAAVIDPDTSELVERFAVDYADLRAHKGMTVEIARDVVRNVSYFGTLMVHTGMADGMVSGAAHSTAHTITPAFEIIKTAPGVSIVSSVFFMGLEDRVLVYGDCAVIPEPTVEELADIAISAAGTAAQFGIDPRIAMLSWSTGSSGAGAEVEKVRAATELVRTRRPDLLVDGPLQYDAAIDASVASAKIPGSEVAGRATVFIFPDLNTGNNTYKAVQRSAGAVAIGPILQGLRKPVNDLSRGATVRDIVNTIAITAIQAQAADPGATPPDPDAGRPT